MYNKAIYFDLNNGCTCYSLNNALINSITINDEFYNIFNNIGINSIKVYIERIKLNNKIHKNINYYINKKKPTNIDIYMLNNFFINPFVVINYIIKYTKNTILLKIINNIIFFILNNFNIKKNNKLINSNFFLNIIFHLNIFSYIIKKKNPTLIACSKINLNNKIYENKKKEKIFQNKNYNIPFISTNCEEAENDFLSIFLINQITNNFNENKNGILIKNYIGIHVKKKKIIKTEIQFYDIETLKQINNKNKHNNINISNINKVELIIYKNHKIFNLINQLKKKKIKTIYIQNIKIENKKMIKINFTSDIFSISNIYKDLIKKKHIIEFCSFFCNKYFINKQDILLELIIKKKKKIINIIKYLYKENTIKYKINKKIDNEIKKKITFFLKRFQ